MRSMTRLKFLNDIRFLLWDLDGTLYPSLDGLSEHIHQRLIQIVSTHRGLSQAEAEQVYQARRNEHKSNTLTLESLGLPGQATFSTLWDEIQWTEFIAADPQLVKQLHGCHLSQGILTNSNERRHIEKKLSALGIESSFFTPIVSSAETGFKKPEPEAFRAALDLLPFAPAQVLYLGDRVDVDILGAEMVGMHTCLIGSEDERADVCAPSAKHLLELIRSVQ